MFRSDSTINYQVIIYGYINEMEQLYIYIYILQNILWLYYVYKIQILIVKSCVCVSF